MKTTDLRYRQLDLDQLVLPDKDIYLAMGYQNHTPDEYIRSMIDHVLAEIRDICVPSYMYRIKRSTLTDQVHLEIENIPFTTGRIIGSYLPGISHTCLFVATAGKDYDAYLHELKANSDIVKEFVADAIGSVIAEACVSEISKELDLYSEWKHTLPYSPGYCGWNIREQTTLFSFFPESPCGITLTESCLMSPVKSISGFFGLGKKLQPQPYRCEVCNNKNCFKRKEKNNDKYEEMVG